MRTTILLDDELAERFRQKARSRQQSLSAFLADAGRTALASGKNPDPTDFELLTFGTGGPQPGIDLNRTGVLLTNEDEAGFGQ